MAGPTATEFKELFPQWASTSDTDVERWLTQAPLRFMPRKFGAQWNMAAYLYVGHQLTLYNPDAADASAQNELRGNIASEKVGDLARSYGSSVDLSRIPVGLHWLTSTTYGLQLIGIIMSRNAAQGRVILTGSSYPGTLTTGT